MKIRSGYEKKRARVEMIPLIDVVFLLLVFFIYAMLSMTVHKGLRVKLPEAGSAEVDVREYVSISVTAEGSILIDETRVSISELAGEVRRRTEGKKKLPVFINGDRRAALGKVVEILDILRRSGVTDVTIETEELKK